MLSRAERSLKIYAGAWFAYSINLHFAWCELIECSNSTFFIFGIHLELYDIIFVIIVVKDRGHMESMTEKVFFSFIREIINQLIRIENCLWWFSFWKIKLMDMSIVATVGAFVENVWKIAICRREDVIILSFGPIQIHWQSDTKNGNTITTFDARKSFLIKGKLISKENWCFVIDLHPNRWFPFDVGEKKRV